MKQSLIGLILFLALIVSAQTSRERIGLGAGGGFMVPAQPINQPSNQPKEYRKIDGKVYSTTEMPYVNGNVQYTGKDGVLILYTHANDGGFAAKVALKHYDGDATHGKDIFTRAQRLGTYDWDGTPLELWDCGTIPEPGEIYQKQSEDYKKEKEIEQTIAANKAATARELAEKKKAAKDRADAAALKANQDSAAKGDSYGLMRMGERYRDGDGVEKDLAKAREYLQKAADAGSITAKDELSKLNTKP